MNSSKFWVVAKLKPNQDKAALKNLERQGFEFFQPTFKTTLKKNNKFKEITKPVFSGYIFVAISLEKRNLHKINSTRGISGVIVFGNEVPVIQTKLIEDLKNQFSTVNLTELSSPLVRGVNVQVATGPFAQLNGKVEEIDADKRVWILLDILGSQTRVSIDKLNLRIQQ